MPNLGRHTVASVVPGGFTEAENLPEAWEMLAVIAPLWVGTVMEAWDTLARPNKIQPGTCLMTKLVVSTISPVVASRMDGTALRIAAIISWSRAS